MAKHTSHPTLMDAPTHTHFLLPTAQLLPSRAPYASALRNGAPPSADQPFYLAIHTSHKLTKNRLRHTKSLTDNEKQQTFTHIRSHSHSLTYSMYPFLTHTHPYQLLPAHPITLLSIPRILYPNGHNLSTHNNPFIHLFVTPIHGHPIFSASTLRPNNHAVFLFLHLLLLLFAYSNPS